jgi:hypothetical protein
MIIPNRHNKNHSLAQTSTDRLQAAFNRKLIGISESGLLGRAERIGDIIASHTGDGGLRIRDQNAVLDVVTVNRGQGAGGRAVGGEELGHNFEGLGGVDSEAWTIEVKVTHAVGVEVAAVGVAEGFVAGTDAALCALASGLLGHGARVAVRLS